MLKTFLRKHTFIQIRKIIFWHRSLIQENFVQDSKNDRFSSYNAFFDFLKKVPNKGWRMIWKVFNYNVSVSSIITFGYHDISPELVTIWLSSKKRQQDR